MEEQRQRAKELFDLYRGHFFQMHRDGVFEEYKKYEIESQIEIDWYNEWIDTCTNHLSIRDWNAITSLESLAKYYQDSRILDNAIAFASRHIMGADSIVKLMYAEKLMDLIKSLKKVVSREKRHAAYQLTYKMLEDIILKPLIIDPGHELDQYHLKDKKSLNSRAKKSMDEIRNVRD
ncbi:hypothetical protein HQN89_18705 [Paenibacillus frigoriresistens]|uniref:hypothetical protein n=1 Tax=Paenibacillus alginolyticus TaxID=59839 RepID=UPI001564BABF|nr:hypothetical protein [Paenibacillus frigoriresistens]NRF93010.1 hypothetical protein [Paenibacillus frigoriresistens]